MRQLSFLPKEKLSHGGDEAKGKRKKARPFSTKLPIHLTLKSEKARGLFSMLHSRNKARVESLIYEISQKHQISLYRHANVGTHLHLLIQARSHSQFKAFLRELSGVIAASITGAIKGRPQKFWTELAYSRLVSWGRNLKSVHEYIIKNLLEGLGAIDRYGKDRGLKIQLLGVGS